ncbi:alpha/beta hydrolase family esterase [Yinghuangia sp. YIM S09857]|uniref:alpha/beta hydrolase family esterase n=1 Tax=Yinghuangia sp. YIM S09857 TaxID=3436929 RepID=UPI003F53832D
MKLWKSTGRRQSANQRTQSARRLKSGFWAAGLAVFLIGAEPAVAQAQSAQGSDTASNRGGCRSQLSPGDHMLMVDGVGVALYVPEGQGRKHIPLVLDLHGSSSSGLEQMENDGIRDVADANRFAVAAPNGAVPVSPAPGVNGWAWNIPGVPLAGTTVFPPPGTRDDVAFVSRVIDVARQAACIDLRRVYATGVSGGGRMASQLACDLAGRIAAVAPVNGVRFPLATDTPPRTVTCDPSRPVPVMAIHGAWDPINVLADTPPPEAPGLPAPIGAPKPGTSWSYSGETAVERWAANNGCRLDRPRVTEVTDHIDKIAYRGCNRGGDVVLYRLDNSGHASPGHGSPEYEAVLNPTNNEVDGTVIAWQFLARHRL